KTGSKDLLPRQQIEGHFSCMQPQAQYHPPLQDRIKQFPKEPTNNVLPTNPDQPDTFESFVPPEWVRFRQLKKEEVYQSATSSLQPALSLKIRPCCARNRVAAKAPE